MSFTDVRVQLSPRAHEKASVAREHAALYVRAELQAALQEYFLTQSCAKFYKTSFRAQQSDPGMK